MSLNDYVEWFDKGLASAEETKRRIMGTWTFDDDTDSVCSCSHRASQHQWYVDTSPDGLQSVRLMDCTNRDCKCERWSGVNPESGVARLHSEQAPAPNSGSDK